MRRIEIDYGEYAGYSLREVPDAFLAALRNPSPGREDAVRGAG